jgi:hypothetical protein
MTPVAEDSGAFKTNPGNSAQFGHFVITPSHGEYPVATGFGNEISHSTDQTGATGRV